MVTEQAKTGTLTGSETSLAQERVLIVSAGCLQRVLQVKLSSHQGFFR
jgi:hypothetical protein